MEKNYSKIYFILFLVVFFNSCLKDTTSSNEFNNPEINTSLGFLPMQIGNYWKTNDQNYTEITDTIRINGKKIINFIRL